MTPLADILECNTCPFNPEKDYCQVLKELMPNGYAKLYYSQRCQEKKKKALEEAARKGVDFLFGCWKNKGKIKYAGHDSQIGTDWDKLKYPFTDYKILKFLDVLSQFEHARLRLQKSEMVNVLLSRQDEKGMFRPESIIKAWSDFDFGQKKKLSRWITLLALRIIKRIQTKTRTNEAIF